MKPFLAQIKADLKLMSRDRAVLFFNYLFPLVFFFIFAQFTKGSGNSSDMVQVIAMVIILGVLSNGFFGAGMRTVQQRETNVLRRFKVTPAGSLPLIVASLVAGVVNFLPTVVLYFVLAKVLYHTPIPPTFWSLVLFVLVGLLAFRAVGMILAAVVNSAQEAQILVQFLYLPMLFLSGATFPIQIMPTWVRQIAYFLPATYLHDGIESIAIEHASIWTKTAGQAVGALLITIVVGVFISSKLFRWEKDEKISGRAKLWILGVLAPFIVLGVVQARTNQAIENEKILERQAARDEAVLFNNVRIFAGDGHVVPNGAVLIRGGKIENVFDHPPADTKSLQVQVIDESGRTLLPGLIDMHVHLGAPGGIYQQASKYMDADAESRRLAAYLYCGITAVRSTGDWLHQSLALKKRIESGELLGSEFFAYGPLFTAKGGHPTELLEYFPEQMKQQAEREFVRLPKTEEEAGQQVDALKSDGVDGIKAVLESGVATRAMNRLDIRLYDTVIAEAAHDGLPSATHTGDLDDIRDAVAAKTNSIEHGARHQVIPDAVFSQMKEENIAYDPTLSVFNADEMGNHGDFSLLNDSLLNRAAPADLIADTRAALAKSPSVGKSPIDADYSVMTANLKRAFDAGVTLIAGSDAGNLLVIHGPTIQTELKLWVQAGIPASAALQAATYNAAKVLRSENRLGLIAKGHDATLLLVDGDPLQDISVLDRIADVYIKGEQVQRWRIFDEYDKK